MPKRLFSALTAKLGADRARPVDAPSTARGTNGCALPSPSPIEQAVSLLSDQDTRTIERVVRDIEIQRILAWEPEWLADTNLDIMLAALQPLLVDEGQPRLHTLSRLALMPVEPLFHSADDVRPWSVPRTWLRPVWVLARRREPGRLAELADRYANLVLASEGCPEPAAVSQIAMQAQAAMSALLADMAQDGAFLATNADVMRGVAWGRNNDHAERLADLLTRLRSAYATRDRAGRSIANTVGWVTLALERRHWREAPELDHALFEIGQAVTKLKGETPAADLARSPAAAFFVLLGRSAPHPWLLVDVIRRRTRMELRDPRPNDTRTTADMAALVEDLIGSLENRAAHIERQLNIARADEQSAMQALFSTAEATVDLSRNIRGIEGAGFLKPQGDMQRRLDAIRFRIEPRVREVLIPLLGALASGPLHRAGSALDADRAVRAAAALRDFSEGSDGLQCRGSVQRVRGKLLDAIQSEIDNAAALVRLGGTPKEDRHDAALAVASALAPEVAASLRRRLGTAMQARLRPQANPSMAAE
ncbi:hypothetical protein [Azospirillum canadense]|uniref:hypothetical protein n=1 Tax=Azospirillum canadense TaxID=403962 RepID=UPI00222767FE|nr:hypothetical protein [Azospirillum canadense]MCW2239261.1 hypothetical protein [Azospirillum canadense]